MILGVLAAQVVAVSVIAYLYLKWEKHSMKDFPWEGGRCG